MRIRVASGLVALALLAPLSAHGQALTNPVFDLERLTLDPSGVGSMLVGGGELLPGGAIRLVLAGQYERDPLVLHLQDGSIGALVENRVTAHLLAAFGITDQIEIGLELPVIVFQNGQNLAEYGLSPVESAGMGNPQLTARYSYFKPNEHFYDVALGLIIGVPVGSPAALGGAGGAGVSGTPNLQGSIKLGPVLTSAQVGVQIQETEAIDTRKIGSEFQAQLGVELFNIPFRPEIVARTAVPFTGVPAGYELMAAARHDLGNPAVEAFLMASMGLGTLPGIPAFRVMLGVAWRPDHRPAAQATPCPPVKPCPPPPAPKKVDPCAPGQVHSAAQCPELDDDNDGILNKDDKCPLDSGAAGNKGCPLPDRDKDGVPDLTDECPDQAGPADNLGCPVIDTDKDGVPDVIDNCPTEPGPASNRGCPLAKKQVVYIEREHVSRIRSRIKLSVAVNFEVGEAAIPTSALEALTELADVLTAHPELKGLRVEGHTDNEGSEKLNQKLSQSRAEAVKTYLEKHGVTKGRLRAQGYGALRGIASNDTEAGRAKNRRVEIVSADEGGNL